MVIVLIIFLKCSYGTIRTCSNRDRIRDHKSCILFRDKRYVGIRNTNLLLHPEQVGIKAKKSVRDVHTAVKQNFCFNCTREIWIGSNQIGRSIILMLRGNDRRSVTQINKQAVMLGWMKLTDNGIDRCSKDRITSTVAATIGSYHGRGCQLLRKSVLGYLHEWSLPVGTDPKEIQPLRSQTVCSVLFCFALLCSVAPHGGWDFKHYIGPCIIRWPTIQRWERILVRTDD